MKVYLRNGYFLGNIYWFLSGWKCIFERYDYCYSYALGTNRTGLAITSLAVSF